MLKNFTSFLCIIAVLCMSITGVIFPGVASAADTYIPYIDEDFDGETISDKITNTGYTIYSDGSGNQYISSVWINLNANELGVNPDELVVEFRAKNRTGNVEFRVSDNVSPWTTVFSKAQGLSDWKYYRFVIDWDDATDKDSMKTTMYNSDDGKTYINGTSVTATNYSTNKKQIRILSGYVDDLKVYQHGTAPTAKPIATKTNRTLTVTSDGYYDAEGDEKVKTAYQWESSIDGEAWTAISGATGESYEITNAYIDNYIRCKVTVVSARYPAESEPVYTDVFGPTTLDFENQTEEDGVWICGSNAGDTVNTGMYRMASGIYDVGSLSVSADTAVIEYRAKKIEGNNAEYFTVNAIFGDWSGMQLSWGEKSTDWKYYRMVVKHNNATSINDVSIKLYTSEDGKEWRYQTSGLTKTEGTISKKTLTQLRINGCYIDDIKVYNDLNTYYDFCAVSDIETKTYTALDSFNTGFKTKNYSGNKDITLYTAVYGSDNSLLAIKSEKKEVACDDKYYPVEISADFDGVTGDKYIKVFMFNNSTDVVPYIPAIKVDKAE